MDVCIKIINSRELNFNYLYKLVSKEIKFPKPDSYQSAVLNFINPIAFCATFGEILNMVVELKSDPT